MPASSQRACIASANVCALSASAALSSDSARMTFAPTMGATLDLAYNVRCNQA